MYMTYEIKAHWDEEAQVWIAESDDVPGLVTEAETFEMLVQKLKVLIPELLALNGIAPNTEEVPFHIVGDRTEKATLDT